MVRLDSRIGNVHSANFLWTIHWKISAILFTRRSGVVLMCLHAAQCRFHMWKVKVAKRIVIRIFFYRFSRRKMWTKVCVREPIERRERERKREKSEKKNKSIIRRLQSQIIIAPLMLGDWSSGKIIIRLKLIVI